MLHFNCNFNIYALIVELCSLEHLYILTIFKTLLLSTKSHYKGIVFYYVILRNQGEGGGLQMIALRLRVIVTNTTTVKFITRGREGV